MSCSTARQLDLLGYGNTWAHRLDSRAKIVLALVFAICVTSFPKYAVAPLAPYLLVPVVLGALGRVPVGLVLRMLAMAAPFAVIAGIFNPWLDRSTASVLGHAIPAGWVSFASIVLRFGLTMSLLLVLTATTSWPGLLHGLTCLRVPAVLVTQLHFLYRYLFVLTEEADRMGHARQLRDPQHRLPQLPVAKRMCAALLWRTWERSERIYRCLKARGFDGDFPRRQADRLRVTDVAFLAAGVVLCVACRFLPVTEWMGGWLVAD